ncbi:MAG: GGDEF domain-containing protein [Rhodocyclaceae bacterium]|nr:GGDEF domain-containing protein [Rhodocyclaceae bacterium]
MIHILQGGEVSTRYSDRSLLEVAIVSAVSTTIGADEVSIYKLQPAGTRLLLERSTRIDGRDVSSRDTDFESPEVAVPMESRPEFEACVCDEQSVAVEAPSGGGFIHCIPVAYDGKIAAVIELIRPAMMNAAELEQVEHFVSLYRNYLSLLEFSERDTLTGLLNRRTFDDQVEKILHYLSSNREPGTLPGSGERREDQSGELPHWIALLDVDNFKRVNARFGHLYGDEVLTLLANLMRETFRHRDKLFRFGGQEFVVVLRPAEGDDVERVLDRFRARVAAHAFPQVGQVTVSIGFAPIDSATTLENVLEHASLALRQAKDNGRNQVRVFRPTA